MAKKSVRRSWIGALRTLFGTEQRRGLKPVRRLRAEQLEGRSLLSVAPSGDIESITLSDYLAAQQDQMGPISPAWFSVDDSIALNGANTSQTLLASQAQGEDDPPPEDPPPEDPPPEDPPPEDPPPEDPPPEDPPPEDPSITDPSVEIVDGTITVGGSLTDNGGISGLTLSLDNATGSVQLNDDGTFTVLITDPGTDPVITITVTDADGNTTTLSLENPT